MTRTTRHLLLRLIDEGFDRRSWHGTNLRGSIRGLRASDLAWRPGPGRHNIWEIVVHAAYWKYVVRRRLRGERRGSFPLKGSNWFVRPIRGQSLDVQWKADVALLKSAHEALRETVSRFVEGDLRLDARTPEKTATWLITGIAAHDLYHAGQIQLLKRLRRRQ